MYPDALQMSWEAQEGRGKGGDVAAAHRSRVTGLAGGIRDGQVEIEDPPREFSLLESDG